MIMLVLILISNSTLRSPPQEEEEVTEEFAEDGDGREELKIKEVLERTIKAIENQCPFEIVQS